MAKHGLGVLLGTAYYFTGRAAAGLPESNVLALVVGILQNLSLHPANRCRPGSVLMFQAVLQIWHLPLMVTSSKGQKLT